MTDDATHSWPVGLQRLAEIIGAAAAARLGARFGGVEKVHIPKVPTDDHMFAAVLSWEELEALSAELGGERIDIPSGAFIDSKKARILTSGGSARAVALRTRCSQRWVRKVRSQVRRHNEPDLFD